MNHGGNGTKIQKILYLERYVKVAQSCPTRCDPMDYNKIYLRRRLLVRRGSKDEP